MTAPLACAQGAYFAAGSAAGLAAIDLVYVAGGRIGPIYPADAVVEEGLVAGWLRAPRRRPR